MERTQRKSSSQAIVEGSIQLDRPFIPVFDLLVVVHGLFQIGFFRLRSREDADLLSVPIPFDYGTSMNRRRFLFGLFWKGSSVLWGRTDYGLSVDSSCDVFWRVGYDMKSFSARAGEYAWSGCAV